MDQDLRASLVERVVTLWEQSPPTEVHRFAIRQEARNLSFDPELLAEDVREIEGVLEEVCERLEVPIVE